MLSPVGTLAAPFPYFGGKARACAQVWEALGNPTHYIEPFCGSAAMLLGRPTPGRVETINDADGFVSNFWRAVSRAPDAVAEFADWPTNETDLFARHAWLVRQDGELLDQLHADPEYFDAKIAGWWCWGASSWIGSGWCDGRGPWVHDGSRIVDSRQLPNLTKGQGVSRRLPHLSATGQGVHRRPVASGCAGGDSEDGKTPPKASRTAFLRDWFALLSSRLRDVRVACGDWRRVLSDGIIDRWPPTGIFLDPPYSKGNMDYAAGGVGGELAGAVRQWCSEHGAAHGVRIVLCGHAGEHDELLRHGWRTARWKAPAGYARSAEAKARSASETLWLSPHCLGEANSQDSLFGAAQHG